MLSTCLALLLLFSHSVMSDSLWPLGLQHAMLPCPSLSPRVCSNSCPWSWWCHLTILSSVAPFSCLNFSQNQGLFQWVCSLIRWPRYWSFSFRISPSSEYSGLISFRIDWLHLLLSKGLSWVFYSTTIQKHQFFGVQPSSWSNCHIIAWVLDKP